ncbi:hypothetical protein ACFQ6U_01770 [Streptomyces sp. NPDC056465]|uniref:hypothetical protein n=1 Tax=Streptomyces sp. NPDC056465 TaxID=3345829 RepID=UPI00368879F5
MTGTRWATAVCPATAATMPALSESDAGYAGPAAGPIASVVVFVAEVAILVIASDGGTHDPQL